MFSSILISIAIAAPTVGFDTPVDLPKPSEVSQVAKTHDGKVVSVTDEKLVMTDNDGKNQHNHMITKAAKVMLDGKIVKITELKAGDVIKVTTAEGVVTMIEATRPANSPK